MPSFAVTAFKETQQRAELEWAGEQVYIKHNWQQGVLCTCPVCLINTPVATGWVSFAKLFFSINTYCISWSQDQRNGGQHNKCLT